MALIPIIIGIGFVLWWKLRIRRPRLHHLAVSLIATQSYLALISSLSNQTDHHACIGDADIFLVSPDWVNFWHLFGWDYGGYLPSTVLRRIQAIPPLGLLVAPSVVIRPGPYWWWASLWAPSRITAVFLIGSPGHLVDLILHIGAGFLNVGAFRRIGTLYRRRFSHVFDTFPILWALQNHHIWKSLPPPPPFWMTSRTWG